MKKHVIGITMGDPAGIGPEICLHAMTQHEILRRCVPILFGSIDVIRRIAAKCRLDLPDLVFQLGDWQKKPACKRPAIVNCVNVNTANIIPGQTSRQCGTIAYSCIKAAVSAAMTGNISAVVTAPINKESLNAAGIHFPGHTEILAALTKARRTCMMMASEQIIVSLATIHVPYTQVPEILSRKTIFDAIELTALAAESLLGKKPRIAVCALNPHAGEHGLFGNEEKRLITPAILKARNKGILAEGPFASDTAFLPEKTKTFDAYVAMYHDQGLIPFKMRAFDTGVNITLGLPIVRTSVDHGTAFDIAWKGKASPNSLIQSVFWALRLIGERNKYKTLE